MSWRKVEEAATRAIFAVRMAYAKPIATPKIGGQFVVHPQELLGSHVEPERVVHEHLRRLVVHANHTMMTDNWRIPGTPHFSYEVERDEPSLRPGAPPSYGPGTLRLRLDMDTREGDLALPEANAKLTEALIGALCVAVVDRRLDPAGERLVEAARRILHEHGHPETITLMGAMVEAAGARRQ